MNFVELKAAAARDIALAFGVPPMLLGLPGDSTYANYREANRALWRLTVCRWRSGSWPACPRGLAPGGPGLRLRVDVDQVTALAEDRERLWAQVSAAEFPEPGGETGVAGVWAYRPRVFRGHLTLPAEAGPCPLP
jgi:phage portal protein BeeE